MPTFDEARRLILDNVAPLGVERVELLSALGRVLAEEMVAHRDLPGADNSAMDGYAVVADYCRPGMELRVAGAINAGEPVVGEVLPGTAVKIMTGACIPPGATAVVPVEETEESAGMVRVCAEVKPGQHIRFRGEDVAAGQVFIPAGTQLRSPEISMLASFGRAIVPVRRRARVAILSTGDELVELGEETGPGRIVNSNSLSLAAAVRECGGEPVILGIARDNPDSHREKLLEGFAADALITSAGVSAGDRDFVRDVLAELGARQLFWRVDIKPGGPLAFALQNGRPVFCLPGNPVSTMITFDEFVRPALLRMMGQTRVFREFLPAILTSDVRKKPGKLNFLRVSVAMKDGVLHATPCGDQNTGILTTMLRADALAALPAERTEVKAGETVRIHLLRDEALMEG